MSCISTILQLKNKPVLDEFNRPILFAEGGGIYKEHEYLITFTYMGIRCGYVALKPDNKYNGKSSHEIDIACHGGLNFAGDDHSLKSLLEIPCIDYWIGFDCGHAFDGRDKKTFIRYFGEDDSRLKFIEEWNSIYERTPQATMKDYLYTENECKSIIDQLIQMKNNIFI